MELELKYHTVKDSMNKYQIEVEDWKRDTTDRFHQLLQEKDHEISELKDTLNLLMKNDDTKEQDDLMNQLLDFISHSSPKQEERRSVSDHSPPLISRA